VPVRAAVAFLELIGSITARPTTHMSTEEKTAIFCDDIENVVPGAQASVRDLEAAAEVIRSFVKQGREDLVGPTKAPPMTVNADQLILRDIRVISAMPLGPGASPMSRCSRRHGARRSLKNGNLGREDAKRKAKESCQMLRIPGEERTIRPRLVQSRSMGRRRRRIG